MSKYPSSYTVCFVWPNLQTRNKFTLHAVSVHCLHLICSFLSGGSRNLERGVELPAREARRKFLGCHAHFRSRERIHNEI